MIQGVAAAITLSWLGLHAVKYDEFNDYLSEYLSGMDLIEGNTTLLPLNFSSQEGTGPGADLPLRVKPLKHAAGYIAAAMNVVNLDNYEASSKASFPVLFRAELNPFVHIGIHGGLEAEPPRVDFLSYPERTGGRVDYVLVWGLRETQRGVPEAQSVLSQLENGYDLIYTSPRRGLMQLYRRKDWRR
jgi:hypothetical protein